MMNDLSLMALTIKKQKRFTPLYDYGGPRLFLASANSMKFEYTAAFRQLSTELSCGNRSPLPVYQGGR